MERPNEHDVSWRIRQTDKLLEGGSRYNDDT